jgi:hypothetical protein
LHGYTSRLSAGPDETIDVMFSSSGIDHLRGVQLLVREADDDNLPGRDGRRCPDYGTASSMQVASLGRMVHRAVR